MSDAIQSAKQGWDNFYKSLTVFMVRANIIRQYYEGLKLSFFFMHNDSSLQFIFARFVKEVDFFFMVLYVHRSYIRLIRDGGQGVRWGGSGTYEQPVPALRPVKTEKTASHLQNNSVKPPSEQQC